MYFPSLGSFNALKNTALPEKEWFVCAGEKAGLSPAFSLLIKIKIIMKAM